MRGFLLAPLLLLSWSASAEPGPAPSLQRSQNLGDLPSATTARTNLGLGTMATQSPGAVAITGGTITSTTVNNRLAFDSVGRADEVTATDGAITASASAFCSASAAFTAGDVGKAIIVNGAGTAGADLITTIASRASATCVTTTAAAATTVSGARYAYGTDNTAALVSLIALAQAGRSAIGFPSGMILVLGAIAPPYTSAGGNNPVQAPVTFIGASGSPDSYLRNSSFGYVAPVGGTILDLRYTGVDTLHPAKIDTRGAGILSISDMTIADYGTDNFLILATTATTLDLSRVVFQGNVSCLKTTCAQDAVQLGGITSASLTLGTTAATAGFQGYGTKLTSVSFRNVRHAVTYGGSANATILDNIWVDASSGSSETDGAAIVFSGCGWGQAGNFILGGFVELAGYPYAATLRDCSGGSGAQENIFDGVGLYDEVLGSPTIGGYLFAAGATYNQVRQGYVSTGLSPTLLNGAGATATLMFGNASAALTPQFPFGVNVLGKLNAGGSTSTNGAFRADIGPGTGSSIMRLNGGNTNAGDGPATYYAAGNTVIASIGAASAISGGAYDATFRLQAATGKLWLDSVAVGIGNATPTHQLDIGNGASGSTSVWLNGGTSTSGGGSFVALGDGNYIGNPSAIGGGTYDNRIRIQTGGGFQFNVNATTVGDMTSVGGWRIKRVVAAKTSNYTVQTTEMRTLFTNTGASAEVDFTLPAAAVGLDYCISVDAAQIVKLIANGTDKIAVGTSNSAAGGNVTANVFGSAVCIAAIKAGQWVSLSHEGTWTVN